MRLFGYKVSSATSGQVADASLDVGVYPVSGQYSVGPGAIAMCMFKWHPASGRWIPYT